MKTKQRLSNMRFPKNFTEENKKTFYTQRREELYKHFMKAMDEGNEELSNKTFEEIKICDNELEKMWVDPSILN